jgi:hypothetical protein
MNALKLEETTKIKMALKAKETALAQLGMAAVGEFLAHFTIRLSKIRGAGRLFQCQMFLEIR